MAAPISVEVVADGTRKAVSGGRPSAGGAVGGRRTLLTRSDIWSEFSDVEADCTRDTLRESIVVTESASEAVSDGRIALGTGVRTVVRVVVAEMARETLCGS